MRIIVTLMLAFSAVISAQAQTFLPVNGVDYLQQGDFNRYNRSLDSNHLQKNWSVSGYIGMGAGIGFSNGNYASFLPAQLGLQLNRRLTNNLYAFTGVVVSPVFFNFNRSLNNTDLHNNYMTVPGYRGNGIGMYSGLQAGLMYVNDQKTFSISGSIGVGRTDPFYPSPRATTQKQPAFTGSRQ